MLPPNNPDRIRIVFDDHRLVANAGLLLSATLAQHLGLRELVDHHLDLGGAPGRANTGDKMLTLVASALAGGDCIDDADALRAGGTVSVLGCMVKAPSTLGTFLRSFRWGHVRQLDRVSRQLLARAWAAGAGPGDSPLTIDLDSTICEIWTGQGGSAPPRLVLLREILEFVEKNRRADGRQMALCLDGWTDDEIQYHARLCVQEDLFSRLKGPTIVYPIELTARGHKKLAELRKNDPLTCSL